MGKVGGERGGGEGERENKQWGEGKSIERGVEGKIQLDTLNTRAYNYPVMDTTVIAI